MPKSKSYQVPRKIASNKDNFWLKKGENPFSSTRTNKRHEKTEVLCATPNTPKHGKVLHFFENPFHGIHFHIGTIIAQTTAVQDRSLNQNRVGTFFLHLMKDSGFGGDDEFFRGIFFYFF